MAVAVMALPVALPVAMAVAVMARTLMPADLVELPTSVGLPKLPHLDLVLLTNRGAPPSPPRP